MLPTTYYRAADGSYKPLAAEETSSGSWQPQNVLRLAKKRLYKRYQMQIRTLYLNQSRVLQLVGCCAVTLCIGFFFTYQLLPSTQLPPLNGSEANQKTISSTISPTSVIISPTKANEKESVEDIKLDVIDVKAIQEKQVEHEATIQTDKIISSKNVDSMIGLTPEQRIEINAARRLAVEKAMIHAWSGYEKFAFGHDEVRPCTNRTNDSWNGWGVTLVDALDTLFLMGLKEQFARALKHVEKIEFKQDKKVSVFETIIRYLGGLLGAYSLSKEPVLLQKAIELADLLLPAFNTQSGLSYNELNLITGVGKNPSWSQGNSILAEVGSVQLEFKYLSHLSNKPVYAETAQRIMDVLDKQPKKMTGLYPVYINPNDAKFTNNDVTFGALADSFYEYLLKQYLLTAKSQDQFKRMYLESLQGMEEHLLGKSGQWTYIAEFSHGQIKPRMDHLVCFVPGMMALGATELNRPQDLEIAKNLMDTCYHLYESSPSGIGPEIVVFNKNGDFEVESAKYFLRPETLESLFVMYRQTHDFVYQDRAWQIFQAIEKYCRTPTAYSGLLDVNVVPPKQSDSMQSFFLAETLKYLWLIFSPDDVLPQSEYIFNTEAHPFQIFEPKST